MKTYIIRNAVRVFLAAVFFIAGAGSLFARGRTEGERLASGRKNINVLREFMDGRDSMLATVALHHYLELNRKNISSAEVVETLNTMVAKGHGLYKTAFVASLTAWRSENRSGIIDALIASEPQQARGQLVAARMGSSANPALDLAAAMLALNAIEVNIDKALEGAAKLNGGLKPIAVPAELLDGGSQTATELALLAAACAADKSVEDAIMRIDADRPEILGAKLYYMAGTGMEISDKVVEYVFREVLAGGRKPSIPLAGRRQTQKLNLFDLRMPGAASACKALALLADKKYLPMLNSALWNEDNRVQIEAVRAIAATCGSDSNEMLLKRIQDCTWPVAVEICAVLREYPDASAVPVLINRLHSESGYLRQHLVYTLSCIAGGQKGQTAEEWKKWWLENREKFTVDKALSKEFADKNALAETSIPGVGYFYGLPIYSDHFVYVVDSSLSMRGERIKSLRENLEESINALKPIDSAASPSSLAAMRGLGGKDIYFSIADFGGRVEIIDEECLINDKRAGVKYAQEMPLTLGTRMFDALEIAMSIPDADTFYLLTDGAPIVGQLDNWRSIIAALRVMTRYRPVAIHCVAFSPRPADAQRMRQIAGGNFGLYGTAN